MVKNKTAILKFQESLFQETSFKKGIESLSPAEFGIVLLYAAFVILFYVCFNEF